MPDTLNNSELQNVLHAYAVPARYSAGKTTKPVNCYCEAPEAGQVFLTGDFNNRDPNSHPLQHQSDGTWQLQVALPHGYHHYQFLVDGKPTLDPRACGTARNYFGEKVSLLAVS